MLSGGVSHNGIERGGGGEGYLVMVTEPVVALVGHNDTGFFRLDGGVGEILRW